MSTRVAIVTGANRGIGFATVRGLCKRFEGAVYLTSRDEERGTKAVEELKKEGLSPKYHQLDITDRKSIENLRDYMKENYGGIDLLINNAGIAFKHDATDPVPVQAEGTLRINYFPLLTIGEILFPILKNGARVVNLSSSCGHLGLIPSDELKQKFLDPNLTEPELTGLMNKYVEDCKKGTQLKDWGDSSYVVSKVGLTGLTFIQQRELKNRGIVVNAVHPGYVDTELTSHKGPLTIDEGAVAPLYTALDLDKSLPYQYIWSNKQIVDWNGTTPSQY